MASFQIDFYTVNVIRHSTSDSAMIFLSSPLMTHGIVNEARLYYVRNVSQLAGAVQNVGGLNFNPVRVFASIPFSDFDRHYHLLKTEAPLSFVYTYGSSPSTTKPLNLISFQSGAVSVGEGLVDIDTLAALETTPDISALLERG